MSSFEERVLQIFHNETKLDRHFAHIIPELFNINERGFQKRVKHSSREDGKNDLIFLYDIIIHDYFFEEIDDWFLSWVIQNYTDRFDADELTKMSALAESYLDFYQVTNVEPGSGCTLQALHTKKLVDLKDVNTSYALTKWDVVMLRCYPHDGAYYMTGVVHILSPDDKSFIQSRLEQEFVKYVEKYDDKNYAHFAKDSWATMIKIVRQVHANRKDPVINTNYGEFAPKELIFSVIDSQEAIDMAFSFEEFEFSEIVEKSKRKKKNIKMKQYIFNWLTRGQENEIETIKTATNEGVLVSTNFVDKDGNMTDIENIGTFFIDEELARLKTNSQELADYAKDRMEQLFKNTLKFKRMMNENIQAAAQAPEKKEELDPEITAELEKQFYRNYEQTIVDEKIPVLNNLTPRQAAKDKKMLPLLIDWLNGLEHQTLKMKQNGKIGPDVERIKKQIGVKSI